MGKRTVIGIHVTNRVKEIPKVQEVLTEFGCSIRTRLGLHQVASESCSPSGLILLEMCGPEEPIAEMERKMLAIEGVDLRKMVFEE